MEAIELRIGNLHIWDGIEQEVAADTLSSMQYGNIESEPIPLTEEWLLKFGFKKGCNEYNLYYSDKTGDIFDLTYEKGNMYLCMGLYAESGVIVKCDSVHQLQNLYFALTGTELKIK